MAWLVAIAVGVVFFVVRYRNSVRRIPPEELKYFVRAPRFSLVFRVINFVGYFLKVIFGIRLAKTNKKRVNQILLDVPASVEKNFGPQDEVIKGYNLFMDELENRPFSPVGDLVFRTFCERLANSRRAVMKWVDEHPAVLNEKINKPVIITGLPRTGSTLLQNLLALDPRSRGIRLFEMVQFVSPVPPATKESITTDPRIAQCAERFKQLDALAPGMFTEMNKSHPSAPDELDEELLILFHQGLNGMLHMSLAGEKYAEWYLDDKNKEPAYIYMKRFLQMLQHAWKPESHWVLKAPSHSERIDTLMKVFPDARVILTHRDPKSVVPSFSKYVESQVGYFFEDKTLDRRRVGNDILRQNALGAERIVKYRETYPSRDQFLDVNYDDLVKDTIGTIRNIYKHFDLHYDLNYEEKIKQYLVENPQGKHGRAKYDMDSYGFSHEQFDKIFGPYIARYLPHLQK